MEQDHMTPVSSDVHGNSVNVELALADDGTVKSIRHVTARSLPFSAETETNGKCPEQLEMMIVKDGVPHAHEAKDFADVLGLGCNCRQQSTLRGDVVMAIMLLSNMLNYMDRFTIVGTCTVVLSLCGLFKCSKTASNCCGT